MEDSGGWGQVNVDANALVRIGAGCGVDEPRQSDVSVGGRLRNRACAGYAIVRPSGPLFLGAEVRQIQTGYASGSVANTHLNLSFGFEF